MTILDYTLFPFVQGKEERNALHLASRNGHESLARDLITMYQLQPNTTNKVWESCVCVDTYFFECLGLHH